ncbi:hypothetical protein NDU88_010418 [Pleurodeles waltl]|uniref:Uncharacterized protein n=1 Tax=Pleurodeles waltl TaxID=8319 RepID=A0AAV7Q1V7_PLEWA|nr:hypothetical protein NDU88_010418 [Pleurodeles waltl]
MYSLIPRSLVEARFTARWCIAEDRAYNVWARWGAICDRHLRRGLLPMSELETSPGARAPKDLKKKAAFQWQAWAEKGIEAREKRQSHARGILTRSSGLEPLQPLVEDHCAEDDAHSITDPEAAKGKRDVQKETKRFGDDVQTHLALMLRGAQSNSDTSTYRQELGTMAGLHCPRNNLGM